jgi:type I restriction enzyme S subunit
MLSGKMYRFRVNSDHIDPRFLEYLLLSPDQVDAIDGIKTGISDSGLNLTHARFRSLELPVAPQAEQERIVSAIEEAFSKLDAGEVGLRTVRRLLKRMRDAILGAAVTGRLVPQVPTDMSATKCLANLGVEPIEDGELPTLPDGWARARVRDIAQVGSGTTPKRGRSDYWDGGTIPWVTSGALGEGVVHEASELVTEAALRETSLRLWPPGTLLVAMYGEGQTRGRCAELAIETTCNQACAAIVLRPELDGYRRLLRLHFDANYSANRGLASGGVQPNLSGAIIKEMLVALPPVDEAERVATEVERQMSFVEACERMVDAGLKRSAALRRSVLKAAFEGRLVPQDPTDEPASVLLERIRAERAAAPRTKPRRVRTKA